MSEDWSQDSEPLVEEDPIEIDAEDVDDLEDAMREALEAVEVAEVRQAESAKPPEAVVEETSTVVEATEAVALQNELQELQEKSLRNLAEFDNYRKRVERERGEERKYRSLEALRDFLGVVDNLERAIDAGGSVEDLKLGVEMILKQMERLLQDHGVERLQAMGEPFDPKFHEAVSRHEDPSVDVPTVSAEMQSGYAMYDRLLRPAMVRVAMPATPTEGENE